jgi:hypothetical protein
VETVDAVNVESLLASRNEGQVNKDLQFFHALCTARTRQSILDQYN